MAKCAGALSSKSTEHKEHLLPSNRYGREEQMMSTTPPEPRVPEQEPRKDREITVSRRILPREPSPLEQVARMRNARLLPPTTRRPR